MSDKNQTETDTSTDNTDEPSKAELHDRVRKLESTVEKLMPSRRDALKLGAAGIAGAAGLSATSGSADASTGSAGQIGDVNNRPDVFADTVDANQLSGVSTGGDRQGCRVSLSSDQSISAGGRTKIQFDSEVYDSGNNFSTSSHAWTCPQDGLYAVNLQVRFDGGSNGDARQIEIGTASSGFVTGEGAEKRKKNSFAGDSLTATTINKYSSGDTIAGYATNQLRNDTIESGVGNNDSFIEVAFLGGL